MSQYPDDLRYTREHEWIRVDGDTGTIGITHHAQEELGDIVFVDLPSEGDSVVKDAEFGTVESVKAVSELYSPVSGQVAEVNATLSDRPEAINDDPYGGGWILKVSLSETSELEQLMDASAYRAFIESDS